MTARGWVWSQLVKKNETSTTIKSRKLNLQKQSVAVDRSGKEVNSRGLTLVEILAHSTHYNANMRKECLAGVRDFFELHPRLLSLHVGAVSAPAGSDGATARRAAPSPDAALVCASACRCSRRCRTC